MTNADPTARRAPPPPNPFAPKGAAAAPPNAAVTIPVVPLSFSAKVEPSGPARIVIHGEKGMGKSTLGANMPKPVFLALNRVGAEQLVVPKLYATPDGTADHADSFAGALAQIDRLIRDPHDRKTLVVDEVDELEKLIHRTLCAEGGVDSIEKYEKGFGKGYSTAVERLRLFLDRLEELQRKRGMVVVFLSHSMVRESKNADTENNIRSTLAINAKAAGVLVGWATTVLFARAPMVVKVDDKGVGRGYATGQRLLYTQPNPAYDAKNRLWLPPEILLSAAKLLRAIEAGEQLRVEYETARLCVDEATSAKAQEYVESANYDPDQVRAVIEQLTGKVLP